MVFWGSKAHKATVALSQVVFGTNCQHRKHWLGIEAGHLGRGLSSVFWPGLLSVSLSSSSDNQHIKRIRAKKSNRQKSDCLLWQSTEDISLCPWDSTVVRNGQYIQMWWRACFSSSYQRRWLRGIITELSVTYAQCQLRYSRSVSSQKPPSSGSQNGQQVKAHLLRSRPPLLQLEAAGPLLSLNNYSQHHRSVPSYRDWKEYRGAGRIWGCWFFFPRLRD